MSSLTSHCAILQTPILYKSHLKLSQFWFWLELFNLKQIKSKGTPWQAVVPLPFLSSAAIATISPWNATEPRPQYTASAKIQFQNQLSTLKFCSWRSMQILKTGNLLKLLNDHTSSNTNLPGFGLFCHKPQQDFRPKNFSSSLHLAKLQKCARVCSVEVWVWDPEEFTWHVNQLASVGLN